MASHQTRAITRNRDRLVCTECRRRKLKCDRSTPCSSCVRRGVSSSCAYQPPGRTSEDDLQRRLQAEERLEHLEKLVQQLAAQQSEATTVSSGHSSLCGYGLSGLELSAGSSRRLSDSTSDDLIYNGSTHWSAMLQDIQAVRSAMAVEDAKLEPPDRAADAGIGLLFGAAPSGQLTFSEVLSHYLPHRTEADRLTSSYFRHKAIAAPFIHSAQFQRLYQAFWASPTSAPPLWTSLLFSICHISSNSLTSRSCGATDPDSPPNTCFSLASAYCLSLGSYFRPQPFAVEALLLFAQAQCITALELSPNLAPLFGSLIRLATQMGYHRDPDVHAPGKFTPFEAEMRRRTWSLAMQLDLMVAFHLGLPSGVQYPTWDTKAPRAVMSADLREGMAELPPEREDTTDILFYVVKHRFMEVFEKILRHALALEPKCLNDGPGQLTAEEKLIALDEEISGVYTTIPEDLRPREMADSIMDSPSTIVARLCVSNIYNKCVCVLHRPYAVLGRTQSVSACWASSKAIVGDMVKVYNEFAPGGQMETEMWFTSSLTWHDFLIGATALCLTLCKMKEGGEEVLSGDIELLARARGVFAEQASKRTKNTGRVVAVIDATIRHVGSGEIALSRRSAPLTTDPTPDVVMASDDLEAISHNGTVHNDWAFADFSAVAAPMEDATWQYLEQLIDLEPQQNRQAE
ncbi:hypothetical protein B0J13DRAFT_538425 [Dactylonectria estremocensis]|uniref:Zn(2)-C6 fungal-type domain-containing protein n=1 Tax=Dactylonectria estremocensis TaxID=1079267 RepID=A0A9P9FK71_9HYPO|nr:hypothetical protein B0J13DRAFT_538425 [Dactylonectria estremocensis]